MPTPMGSAGATGEPVSAAIEREQWCTLKNSDAMPKTAREPRDRPLLCGAAGTAVRARLAAVSENEEGNE
jgi:hypothetical protein